MKIASPLSLIRRIGGVYLFAALSTAGGQIATPDSVPDSPPLISRREAVMGGASILATIAIAPFDQRLAQAMQEQTNQQRPELQRFASDVSFMGGPGPFIVGGGLYVAGRLMHSPRFASAGVDVTKAVVLAAVFTGLGKGIFGRSRPDYGIRDSDSFKFGRGFRAKNGRWVSFPSGHAGAAFAVAAALTSEAKLWHPRAARFAGPLMYGGAALVGLARMYQNFHWASDLPLAAAIGTWSGVTVVARDHAGRQASTGTSVESVLRSATLVPMRGARLGVEWALPL